MIAIVKRLDDKSLGSGKGSSGGPARNNALLMHLPSDEDALIGQALQPVALRPLERLVEKDKPINYIYFLDEGWASVMFMSSIRPVEVAIIGSEGVVGLSVFLGRFTAANSCHMQTHGSGHRIETERLQDMLPLLPRFQQRILAYVQDRLIQSYEAVVATTVGSLEARVSRAILLCHDRANSDDITITQDQLARKVGANRAGVTTALHVLEGQRIIRSKRRCIHVLDRLRLESAAAGTYAKVHAVSLPR